MGPLVAITQQNYPRYSIAIADAASAELNFEESLQTTSLHDDGLGYSKTKISIPDGNLRVAQTPLFPAKGSAVCLY